MAQSLDGLKILAYIQQHLISQRPAALRRIVAFAIAYRSCNAPNMSAYEALFLPTSREQQEGCTWNMKLGGVLMMT